jgi:hypothetical protein
VAADRPAAQLAARLCDVAPDGTSVRVSYGLVDPGTLEPGRPLRVELRLRDAAHAFARGHRVRLALSTGYWPIAWPAPEPIVLSVFTERSRLELPVRPPAEGDADLRPFPPPETAAPLETVELRPPRSVRVIDDGADGTTVYRVEAEGGVFGRGGPCRIVATGVEVATTLVREYRLRRGEPLSASASVEQKTSLARDGWAVAVRVRARLGAAADAWRFEADVCAEEAGVPAFTRRYDLRVPRATGRR